MSISSISSSSYYNTSLYSKKSEGKTEEELAELLASQQSVERPEGPPPPKPPEDGINPEDAVYSVEDLTNYLDFVAEEYGIEIDATEFIEGKETLTGSEIKTFLEENGLEFSAPPEPPKEPPVMNSTDEQMSIMAQMQSTSSVTAQSFNISDYLTIDEDSESEDVETLISKLKNTSNSLSTNSLDLEDILLDAYADMYSQNTYQSSLFSI